MPNPGRIRQLVTFVLCLGAAPLVQAQVTPDVTISVFSAAYQATFTHDTVVVGAEIHGSGDRLEIRYAIISGPSPVTERTIVVPLEDDAVRAKARREGVRVLTQLTLAPGRYQLRVTTSSLGSQATGTVVHDIEVPQLATAALNMSGLALTSSSVDGHTHAEVEDDHRMLPILGQPPTARREFSQAEKVEVHAEFYEIQQPEFEFDQQINVITRMRSASGDVVWELKENGTSEALSGGRFGYVHSMLIPVSTLPPGQYVVEVGAETLYGAPGYVSRFVPIRITSSRVTP